MKGSLETINTMGKESSGLKEIRNIQVLSKRANMRDREDCSLITARYT